MKTLTEFSTLTLRKAAAARATVAGARRDEPPVEAASEPPAEPEALAEAAPAEAGEAPVEAAPAEAGEASAEGAEAPATPAGPADPAIDAIATALSVQPDRAARLIEALDIVGNAIEQVRLVRVYQGEKGPHNAISRGEFHYVIDRVAGQQARRGRDDRGARGGDRGGRSGGGGGGGGGGGRGGMFGGDRKEKPRGLSSLVFGAKTESKNPDDDRPGRGEMPHAGIGWQLTAAPRDFAGGPGRGRGPGRGPGRGRGPGGGGGPGGDRGRGPGGGGGPGDRGRGPGGGDRGRGPGGPRGPRNDARFDGPRPGFGGPQQDGPRPQRFDRTASPVGDAADRAPGADRPPPPPRLGPDGQPLPPRSKRPRKPIGPDANGLGPDGKPWDPERRAKRVAERATEPQQQGAPVESSSAPEASATETPTE